MRFINPAGGSFFCALALFFVLSGCVSKIPPSLPLAETEKPKVLQQFQEFQSSVCRESLDADVTLVWELLGRKDTIPGMLQLQYPEFLRYAVVDPLGRQLLILVSDGNSFTLVENRKAKAITGLVGSNYWKKYIPGYIAGRDYIPWLTARLPSTFPPIKEIRQDKEIAKGIWIITDWQNHIRHHVLFLPEPPRIQRHIIENNKNTILLDIKYSGYQSNKHTCETPHTVKIEGADISGTLNLRFDEIFPEALIPAKLFYLTPPDHFTVNTVE